MIEIHESELYILSESEGGAQDLFPGIRPSFNIDGDLILCIIYPLGGEDKMLRGHSYKVRIELPYGDMIPINKSLHEDAEFKLQLASQVLAVGKIIAL